MLQRRRVQIQNNATLGTAREHWAMRLYRIIIIMFIIGFPGSCNCFENYLFVHPFPLPSHCPGVVFRVCTARVLARRRVTAPAISGMFVFLIASFCHFVCLQFVSSATPTREEIQFLFIGTCTHAFIDVIGSYSVLLYVLSYCS